MCIGSLTWDVIIPVFAVVISFIVKLVATNKHWNIDLGCHLAPASFSSLHPAEKHALKGGVHILGEICFMV